MSGILDSPGSRTVLVRGVSRATGARVCHDGMSTVPVVVGAGPLAADDVVRVARAGAGVRLGPDARAALAQSRKVVDALADDPVAHYGISTGFGALATTHIPRERRA